MVKDRAYIAIDLKSFYASVECVDRGLDPLNTNLVVADSSRTEKTICLAVSPSLKAYGIHGRARLFEVVQRVREINVIRRMSAPGGRFEGSSCIACELKNSPELELDYLVAPPRMARYIEYSAKIYGIYLKYISEEDIHVYSIDEVFMDVTDYLDAYSMTPYELAMTIVRAVFKETGITATAGIGTNLYLSKVAMDIEAKSIQADGDGVRIAELDEMSYRKKMWSHRPLTDFWRVGRGYAKKLEEHGLYTMGDVARCSVGDKGEYYNEALLYKLFGVNAELLIDHAWGVEPCTIKDIKEYRPKTNSIGSGQVLQRPYAYDEARLILKEMTDLLVLDLVDKGLVTDQIVINVGYDIENLKDEEKLRAYKGEIKTDHFGRRVPKHAHGTANIDKMTSSTRLIMDAAVKLYEHIVDESLLIRRISVTATHVIPEEKAVDGGQYEQLNFFTDYEAKRKKELEEKEMLSKERKIQKAVLDIRKKYGKNALLKGMNLEKGANTISRNNQIGGHRAY